MPNPIVGAVGLVAKTALEARAANKAADAQSAGAEMGIAEQARQFDAAKQILAPYVSAGTNAIQGLSQYANAGTPALEQQQALLGLRGADAQQQAISAIERGGLYQESVRQGENALLQNASATGGLRGGNLQAALAQFRPQMLNQAIDQQYGRLGGLTALGQTTQQNIASLGQASAAGQASAGLQTGSNIAGLLGERGAAQAGGYLGQAKAYGGLLSGIGGLLGYGK